jgi:hypothetical protein
MKDEEDGFADGNATPGGVEAFARIEALSNLIVPEAISFSELICRWIGGCRLRQVKGGI